MQLLLRASPESPSGRVPIYVCGECGDLGCGAVTAKVELTPEGYVWKDFGYENDYAPEMSDFVSYREVGPFLFDKERYRRLFSERLGPL